jgi:hypothetical protein
MYRIERERERERDIEGKKEKTRIFKHICGKKRKVKNEGS